MMHLREKLFEDPVARGLATPHIGRGRRVAMPLLLALLLAIIGGYLHITDADRVRVMAESYLSGVSGAQVSVRRARLSIFEGLRLDGVTMQTNGRNGRGEQQPIFSADTLLVRTEPASLLRGRIVARQLIAINPQLRLVEDLASGEWNYSALVQGHLPGDHAARFELSEIPVVRNLPEILLRNARIDYSELRGGQEVFRNWMGVEARVSPDSTAGVYNFHIQSRGARHGPGPSAGGTFDTNAPQVIAHGRDINLGQDFRSMATAEIRRWCEERGLSGIVDIPHIVYRPGLNGRAAEFTVIMQLKGVQLTLDPNQWRSREERARLEALRGGLEWMQAAGLGGGQIDALDELFDHQPIQLDEVEGELIFTQNGIEIRELVSRVEGKRFHASGFIEGYSPDSPADLTISSIGPDHLVVPQSPAYINALPTPVRKLYYELYPQGRCSVSINVRRGVAGGRIEVNGEINIIDGQFVFDEFPYPVRQATGRILIEAEPERVVLENLTGRGLAGGPNADAVVTVNGWIGPFAPGSGVQLRIEGRDLHSETALHAAFPIEAREALRMFRGLEDIYAAQHGEEAPVYRGDFVCEVEREIGLEHRMAINVDIDLKDGRGTLVDFPYPLEGLSGTIRIRPDHVLIEQMRIKRGEAELALDGRVDFGGGRPVTPQLQLRATNVPIDEALLASLPAGQRRMVEQLRPGGRIDVEGSIFRDDDSTAASPGGQGGFEPAFDLAMHVHDGRVSPQGSEMVIEQVGGRMRLTRQQLELIDLAGARDGAILGLRGRIGWIDDRPRFDLHATGENLLLDEPLYTFLPASARQGWDQVQPEGRVDFDLRLRGSAAALEEQAAGPQPGDVTPPADLWEEMELTILPRGLSATVQALPYRLDELTGAVHVNGEQITLENLVGRHGDGILRLSGQGGTGASSAWRLRLSGEDVLVDQAFVAALPEALRELVEAMNVQGRVGFDFTRLDYRERPAGETQEQNGEMGAKPSDEATKARSEQGEERSNLHPFVASSLSEADVDFEVVVTADGTALEVGVPLGQIKGELQLSGQVREGRLSSLDGRFSLPSLTLSDRPVRNMRATLRKPADLPVLQVQNMQGELAGGELGGQVVLAFPGDGPSRYALSFVLRNGDIREMAGELDTDVRGQVNASLALEGSWDDPSTRRGRGDVLVSGRQMYRIPVLIGLVQIADLSLPLTSPFNAATARYSVDGQRLSFEQIELRSSAMLMQGSGTIDFDSGNVRMRFITDNPRALKVPFVHEFLQGVRQELLQITIQGTVEQPRVGARSFVTVQMTVDEVLRGER